MSLEGNEEEIKQKKTHFLSRGLLDIIKKKRQNHSHSHLVSACYFPHLYYLNRITSKLIVLTTSNEIKNARQIHRNMFLLKIYGGSKNIKSYL